MLNINELALLPCSAYDSMDKDTYRIFCHMSARYLIPTTELIEFLTEFLEPYKKEDILEIGAGCGDLGRNLGIRMTDNFCQSWPDVKAYYERLEQPVIKYGLDVEEIDAIEAVKKYKPKVVIGAWVTQWIDPDKPPERPGSIHGIKENEILDLVDMYMVIGAEEIHKRKYIMDRPHEAITIPFIRSRTTYKNNDDRIYIWRK